MALHSTRLGSMGRSPGGGAAMVMIKSTPPQASSRATAGVTAGAARSPGGSAHSLEVRTDDGVRLAVRVHGEPTAACTVVFLHGLCLSQASWVHQIVAVTQRFGPSVQVVSYDHRGHGESAQAPTATYSIDRLAADLGAVLDAVAPQGKVILVGHSMGGMAAVTYCAQAAQQRAIDPAGLILVASAAGHLTQFGLGRLLTTPGAGVLFQGVEHAPTALLAPLRRFLAGPVCAGLSHFDGTGGALAAVAASALVSTPLRTAVGFLPALRDFDQYGALGAIHARTVVLSGGVDVLTPSALAAELVSGIPACEHVHLPRCGHMLPQQAAGELDGVIAAAITLLCRPRRRRWQRRTTVSKAPGRRTWSMTAAAGALL